MKPLHNITRDCYVLVNMPAWKPILDYKPLFQLYTASLNSVSFVKKDKPRIPSVNAVSFVKQTTARISSVNAVSFFKKVSEV